MVPSLWAATAGETAPQVPVLTGDTRADVAIIGGGFTGLSTALHLRDRGIDVALIEAEEIGWGASGRNGGQVNPGLKLDPDDIVAQLGRERGEQLVALCGGTADTVWRLIERFGIACDPVRSGWIQGAHSERALPMLAARAEQWRARGAPVETLTRARIAELTGSTRYHGGLVDRRAGTINPLAYVRGLARGAQSLGARLFRATPARELRREGGGWRVVTPKGSLRAERVVIGTNAYTDGLWPGLAQTVLTVQSIQIATQPLGHNEGGAILPGGEHVSETRKLAYYFRRDPTGRLVIGGRGPAGEAESPRLFGALGRALRELFPHLPEPRAEFQWSGRVALTLDALPHLHEPAPGLHIALGYNGRGVAMASTMGRVLAERIAGEDIAFPVTSLHPIPWHAARRPLIAAGIAYHRLRDRLGFAS